MLDQITDLVRQYAGDAVVNNPQIPNEKNEDTIHALSGGLASMLGNQGGGLAGLASMFGGGSNVGNSGAGSQLAAQIAAKVGISPQIAQGVVSSILPMLMAKIAGGGGLGSLLGGQQTTNAEGTQEGSLGGLLSKIM